MCVCALLLAKVLGRIQQVIISKSGKVTGYSDRLICFTEKHMYKINNIVLCITVLRIREKINWSKYPVVQQLTFG